MVVFPTSSDRIVVSFLPGHKSARPSILQIKVSIEVSRVQVAVAVNRALVGNQHKPRTKRSFLGIEDVSPAMHKQEHILKEVVRFGSIAQNAYRNSYQS